MAQTVRDLHMVNVTYLPSLAQPEDYEMIATEEQFRRRVTKVYRIAFSVFALVAMLLSGHLAIWDQDWVPAILALGVSLTCFKWFITSFVDERFD